MYLPEQIRDMSNKELRFIAEQLAWLECLESAGVDNWSGIDFAKELYLEEYPEEDEAEVA